MNYERRNFLKKAGVITAGGMLGGMASCQSRPERNARTQNGLNNGQESGENHEIRSFFDLNPEYIHLAGLLISSHPTPVREAIQEHRESFNNNPAEYVQEYFSAWPTQARQAAAEYMNVQANEIALTDSTTMGTALLINGLRIREDQEMITADYDYYSTHESLKYKAQNSGASYREISIYDDVRNVSADEIVNKYLEEIKPSTRLVTGTWVHSATGLKIPVREIAAGIAEVNANRSPEDRVIFFVDGVHGFGVENQAVGELGCDFFSAGTHKWMYGPRGTGILWGNSAVHNQVLPTIPTFTNGAGWGGRMTPGGFKPFEHQWSLVKAFEFHQEIGKENVQDRIYQLARQLKEGLGKMEHITLYTPMDENLSSGIVCFAVNGMAPRTVVNRLADQNIIISNTPYEPSYARLTPCIYNTNEEMERTLEAIRDLG